MPSPLQIATVDLIIPRPITVSYFSGGVSSAVATKLAINEIDRIIYTHIDDQHPDTMRFVKDCEKWFGKQVEILQSRFKTVDEACRFGSFIQGPTGASCTRILKKAVRKQFEKTVGGKMRIVWGMDSTESDRIDKLKDAMPEHDHLFPLLDKHISKDVAHQILRASGVKRPAMYDMGYKNNNCVGCVRGGMGYWNKIRVDFPEVFESRAKLERIIGREPICRGVFLDELDPERGRKEGPIVGDCGIMCELMSI
jgi:3'-phosphoadenosine 5'-phosphosulfate sulfotransferase (PAPS reductase)/FAD synthetase